MKFSIENRDGEIASNQKVYRSCYIAAMEVKEKTTGVLHLERLLSVKSYQ